jgi:outer membrane protein assembly factor BamB
VEFNIQIERLGVHMLRILAISLILFSSFSFAKVEWQYKVQGRVTGQPVIYKNLVYILAGQSLSVLNKSGELQWQYKLKAKTYSKVVIENDTIYLLADNGLHAITTNGESKWFFASKDKPLSIEGETWGWGKGQFVDPWSWYRSSPIVANDKVIFGNAQGTYALSSKTGEKIWHVNTGVTQTKPAYYEGIVVIGSWDNHLYGINENDGSIAWKFVSRTPQGEMADWNGWDGFNLDPVIYNGVIYVGNRGSYFYAINAKTGVEKWSSQYAGTWVGSAAIESNGEIFFGTSDGFSLVGLNAKSGSQTLLHTNDFYNFAQPQVNNKTIYFATVSGQLIAVDRKTSQSELIFSTPQSLKNLPDVIKETGGLKRKYGVNGNYSNATELKDIDYMHKQLDSILSVTLDNQMIYLGSANGNVFAISL